VFILGYRFLEMICGTFEGLLEGTGIDCPLDAELREIEVAGTSSAY
jgi:hypothetical protein